MRGQDGNISGRNVLIEDGQCCGLDTSLSQEQQLIHHYQRLNDSLHTHLECLGGGGREGERKGGERERGRGKGRREGGKELQLVTATIRPCRTDCERFNVADELMVFVMASQQLRLQLWPWTCLQT